MTGMTWTNLGQCREFQTKRTDEKEGYYDQWCQKQQRGLEGSDVILVVSQRHILSGDLDRIHLGDTLCTNFVIRTYKGLFGIKTTRSADKQLRVGSQLLLNIYTTRRLSYGKSVVPVTTTVRLSNGISFRPTVLAGCTSVTDDTHTHARVLSLTVRL